jgi:dienelactone hydrolase
MISSSPFGRFRAFQPLALLLAISMSPMPARAEMPAGLAIWPSRDAIAGVRGEEVTFASHSPFSLVDVGAGPSEDPPTQAEGTLFLPEGASARTPVPAVVLLHGASGVQTSREMTYGRQLAGMGIAALVVDAFAARRDLAQGFVQRLLEITEAMVLADAYAALRYFATRPEIDERRVVLMGFSYGGMVATYAAYRQTAMLFAPDGRRFAGHVAFYAPCIARFDDRRTTGAPVLMLMGSKDEIIDEARCALAARDLEEGGSEVRMIVYEGAYHQWDGGRVSPWRAPRNLVDCRFVVEPDGDVRDADTFLPMVSPFTRKVILALCTDRDGYLIARDDDVRAKSNREVGRFLARVLYGPGHANRGQSDPSG